MNSIETMASDMIDLVKTTPEGALAPREKNSAGQQWLTLKDASEFLGVHFTTLRTWADNGEIQVFRTPGGHRRFGLSDLRRFLEERVGRGLSSDATTLVDTAVRRAQQEIEKAPKEQMRWHYALDEQASVERRQRGRQLFALALAYVLKPAQRPRILEEGRKLGREYGQEAYLSQVSLAAAGRAVRFFRNQLIQAVQNEDHPDWVDAEDMRIQQWIDHFLDEVLYAVLDGYEQHTVDNVG